MITCDVDRDTQSSAPLQPQFRHGVETAAAAGVLSRCFVCDNEDDDDDDDEDHSQGAMTSLS